MSLFGGFNVSKEFCSNVLKVSSARHLRKKVFRSYKTHLNRKARGTTSKHEIYALDRLCPTVSMGTTSPLIPPGRKSIRSDANIARISAALAFVRSARR